MKLRKQMTRVKLHKKISCVFMVCLLVQTFLFAGQPYLGINDAVYAQEEFAGGNGTEGNPYKIENYLHLNNVRNYLDAYFIQTKDIDLTAATQEGGVFYNERRGWDPIGNYQIPFIGEYDGGGFAVLGLYLNKSSSGHVGLFGDNRGVIKNLGMVAAWVYTHSSYGCGGITGYNYGTIVNCYNTMGWVSSSTRAGGIAGYNSTYGTITNCYNTDSASSYYAGGIAGGNDGTIENCYNTGSVSGYYAGGIVGDNNYTTIANCYNTGSVSSYSSYVGGIAGDSTYDCIIENCYTLGGESYNEIGNKLTAEEMKTQANFVGFDFDLVWEIDNTINRSYPILKNITYDRTLNCTIVDYNNEDNTSFNVVLTNNTAYYVTTDVFVALYDDNGLLEVIKYNINNLEPGYDNTKPIITSTTQKPKTMKVLFFENGTIKPVRDDFEKVL